VRVTLVELPRPPGTLSSGRSVHATQCFFGIRCSSVFFQRAPSGPTGCGPMRLAPDRVLAKSTERHRTEHEAGGGELNG
jgi:hypothetical protein